MADYERRCSHTNFEQVYWSQFGTVKFGQRITDNSGNSLVLPRTFVENVRDKLVGNVKLITANGSVWVIGLDSRDERDVSLKGGWKKFFKAHCLKKNDILSFSYHHDFNFDVTMFDGETGCEKICAYFVKSEMNLEAQNKNDNNEKEISVSDDDKKLVRRCRKRTAQNLSNEEDWDHFGSLNKGKKVSTTAKLLDKGKGSKSNVVKLEEGSGIRRGRNLSEEEEEEDSDHFDMKTYDEVSQEMERKERNLKRMIALAEREGDLVVRLQPSYVSKPWVLAISANWARQEGLDQRKQEIELHCDGKMWKGILGNRKVAADINSKCWKDFVTQNDLKVGDACVFNVIPGSSHPIAISVCILRL
ncbi:hypothetical protein ACJIZ3_009915 [Penstemon smallii]|uniref:TF-B3 domain-containing protein n=1 Tax=Penstemon smallii TaxID=265156 RepID=A0ABD3TDV0_9LAMI